MNSETVITPTYIDPRPSNKKAAFLLFAMVFLYVGRAHEAVGGPIRFNLIFTAITLLFCLSDFFKSPLEYFKQSVVLRRITYFTIWVLICIPFSRWPGGSVEAVTDFLKTYVFIFLSTIILIRYKTTKTGVLAFIVGLLVVLFFSVISDSASARVSTITSSYDPNEMALLAVMILPILFFAIKNAKRIWKLFYSAGLAVCVVAIALTGSRGGMLGLLMVGWYILFVSSIGKMKKVLIVVVAMGVFVVAVPQDNWDRLAKTFDIKNDYNVSGKSGRLTIWAADLVKIAKNPVTGVGFGQSTTLEGDEQLEGVWMEAHNSYIEMALEGGLPGFVLLFSVMLVSWWRLRSLRQSMDKNDKRMALVNGLEGGLWGYFVCIMFLSVIFYGLSLYFFVIIEAVYKDIKGDYLVEVHPPMVSEETTGLAHNTGRRRYVMRSK